MIWGSDTPFQSFAAKENGAVLALRSTYEEEIGCLRSVPEPLQSAIGHDNLLAYLKLKDTTVLT